jgi:hypothetical protein
MLVIGIIFAIVFSILLINDLESNTITQWTVMSSYFMIIFMIIGITLRITQNNHQISCPVVTIQGTKSTLIIFHSSIRSAI